MEVQEISAEATGFVKSKRFTQPSPGTYFETLYLGVAEWYDYLGKKALHAGLTIEGDLEAFWENWTPMSYETTQKHSVNVFRNGKHAGMIIISIYRLPSGRYESTSYCSA